MALEFGQLFENTAGVQVSVTSKCDAANSIGDIYTAVASMGTLQSSLLVTETGLYEAGFTLVVVPVSG